MKGIISFAPLLVTILPGLTLLADDGKFTIYMAGKPIASEAYSVQKADGKLTIEGSGKAELGTMKIDIQKFKVVMDDKYHPLTASAHASMGQMTMAGEITFAEGKAQAEMTMGQSTQHKETEVHDSDLVVNSNLPLFPWTVLALRARKDTSEPPAISGVYCGTKRGAGDGGVQRPRERGVRGPQSRSGSLQRLGQSWRANFDAGTMGQR